MELEIILVQITPLGLVILWRALPQIELRLIAAPNWSLAMKGLTRAMEAEWMRVELDVFELAVLAAQIFQVDQRDKGMP